MHKAAKLTTIRTNAQLVELIEHDVHSAMSSYWPPDKPKPHALSRFPLAARYFIEGPFLAEVAKAAKPAIYRVLSDLQFEGCNGCDCLLIDVAVRRITDDGHYLVHDDYGFPHIRFCQTVANTRPRMIVTEPAVVKEIARRVVKKSEIRVDGRILARIPADAMKEVWRNTAKRTDYSQEYARRRQEEREQRRQIQATIAAATAPVAVAA